MGYTIENDDEFLYIEYSIEDDSDWINTKIKDDKPVCIRNTFNITYEDIKRTDEETYKFKIGVLEGNYYKLINVLYAENDIYFSKDIYFTTNMFWGAYKVSIIKAIDKISESSIYIGGEFEDAIPTADFMGLIKTFPNSTEIQKYKEARIGTLINEYVNLKKDYQEEYESYIANKIVSRNINTFEKIKEFDLLKYEYLHNELTKMLSNIGHDRMPTENDWELKVKEFILLLFPQYIKAFTQVNVKGTTSKDKRPDFILIDTNGYVDVLEIKRPNGIDVFRKRQYRNNYVLSGELSGTIMQVEKYVFCLNKYGISTEDNNKFTEDIKIKIANPRGLIIMGRSNNFSDEQKEDFEIIKRKYKHIADIITYDDLLNRLSVIIKHLKHN